MAERASAADDRPLAKVIPFPRPKTCWTCAYAEFRDDATTFCQVFEEPIHSEVVAAQSCDVYEYSEE